MLKAERIERRSLPTGRHSLWRVRRFHIRLERRGDTIHRFRDRSVVVFSRFCGYNDGNVPTNGRIGRVRSSRYLVRHRRSCARVHAIDRPRLGAVETRHATSVTHFRDTHMSAVLTRGHSRRCDFATRTSGRPFGRFFVLIALRVYSIASLLDSSSLISTIVPRSSLLCHLVHLRREHRRVRGS